MRLPSICGREHIGFALLIGFSASTSLLICLLTPSVQSVVQRFLDLLKYFLLLLLFGFMDEVISEKD